MVNVTGRPGILRVSQAFMMAVKVVILLERASKPMSSVWAAQSLGAPAAYISKVLQRLARAGIVSVRRGYAGGYYLERPLSDITLREVLEVIDGPLVLSRHTACSPAHSKDRSGLGRVLDSIVLEAARQFEKPLSEL